MNTPNIAGTLEEQHQLALEWTCEAFLIHQVAMHRRAIYRHRYGDIAICSIALQGFIDTHLEDSGYSMERRFNWYMTILDTAHEDAVKHESFLAYWGQPTKLTHGGIHWFNCLLDQFGDMVQELGPDVARKLMGGESEKSH
ncbi:hypothetical protein J5069_07585 [Candidatus Symbiopectobacterium sp. NZEC127]|uniref:hypothetical protein n=1 Tax=Candidatus Symbiopectobacterium sp. NZEC127 TaxID=2820472 RepID=UPI002227C01F|nr:hypothetical protein [Candidatus Symbiopectobacterium sp. NZEC127]MCW2485758.1 hypothetical protein [Candidatus Symbiopectobacterium sp. NZEC127]